MTKIVHTSDALEEDMDLSIPKIHLHEDTYKRAPSDVRDFIAKVIVHLSARCADLLFRKRYGERAVVLETIAAVPGMVGGILQHLKALRLIRDDRGWIKSLVDEAENERMHLLIYSHISKPSFFERILIVIVQFFFFIIYFLLYIISPKTAHRTVGYFEEEAIHSYMHFLELINSGDIHNVHAPEMAKTYWGLKSDAMLKDMVMATIRDEMIHRDTNHAFADDSIGTSLWGR